MRIILLDLNYTLVSNSEVKLNPFEKQIENETYRSELISKLRNDYVILITARPEKYKRLTMESLRRKVGFTPFGAFFNKYNLRPPQSKERVLTTQLFKSYNREAMLAIESNPQTRAMYKRHNIKAVTYQEFMEL